MSHQEECIFQAQRITELESEIKAKDGYIKGLEDTVDNLYSIIGEYKKALEMACGTLANCLYHHPENHIEEEMRRYLQKAREE